MLCLKFLPFQSLSRALSSSCWLHNNFQNLFFTAGQENLLKVPDFILKTSFPHLNKALNAIKLIKIYFEHAELVQLITSNFYSVLYYNSEVWNIPTLGTALQNRLLSASARALKICSRPSDLWMLSFNDLHELVGRATSQKLRNYKSALQLYKTKDLHIPTTDWINLNLNAVVTSRQTKFIILIWDTQNVVHERTKYVDVIKDSPSFLIERVILK